MQRTYLCVYFLMAGINAGYFWLEVDALPEGVNCDRVKYTFEQKGFAAEVPRRHTGMTVENMEITYFIGTETSVCGADHCCTEEMQRQLSAFSRREFIANHTKHMADLAGWLQQRADKFDDVFREMLNSSRQGFHAMFMKTYGVIYEQNSYVFTDLFKELEKYYTKGHVDLTATLDDFFNTLYQKMFTVLNAGYTFTDKYLECVNEKMKELKPFGDVPGKLSTLLKRSFYATRTFSQGLHVAADIVKNMQNLTMSESCHTAVTKMFHCSACSGHGELLPCPDYCISVMKSCYSYHLLLESHWNSFVDASDKVIERLLGPFNIEMVIIPIDIKISEAIMNFQENAQQVTQRVFSGCGKPQIGRSKRANGEIEFETLDFSNRGMDGLDNGRGGKGEEPGKLERVIRDTRAVLKDSRGFWGKMPSHMCKNSNKANLCWDGKTKVKSPGPQRAPEVNIDTMEPSSLVNEQIFALRQINVKLKNAYNGLDVDWIDSEGMDGGSGSGSGSGIDISESGSGDAPTEIPESPPYPAHPSSGGVPPGGEEDKQARPESDNTEPNEIPPIPDLGRIGNTTRARPATGSGSRVVFSFIVPIILVSFGSTIVEWVW